MTNDHNQGPMSREITLYHLDSGNLRGFSAPVSDSVSTSPKSKYKALDLFCGAGGASMGLHRAGFDVTGVDIKFQPRYPFKFVEHDVLNLGANRDWVAGFDFIWASPPCQAYSRAMRHLAKPKEKLIDRVREMLVGRLSVIENVVGAPLRANLILCGTMFGLPVYRHRIFECSWPISSLMNCDHRKHALNPHQSDGRQRIYDEHGRQDPEKLWRAQMGVPWMNKHEGREAIPPAYSEFIGKQALQFLTSVEASS